MSCKYSQDTNIEVEFQLEKAVKIHYVDVGKTQHVLFVFFFLYWTFWTVLVGEVLQIHACPSIFPTHYLTATSFS